MFRIRTFFLLFLTTQILGALGALTWKTFDISSLLVEEAANVKYQDVNGNTKNLEVILKENGANNIKIRIWVNPSDGVYNLDYAVKLGLRAKNAGLSVTLNLHYSDTWADPGHQTTPSAWSSYTITQLAAAVKSYTTNVLNTFAANGINVNLISIGNEIRAGLLWPLGSYTNFANIGTLLTAGAQGVRASSLSSALIMIHLDEGYSWDTQKWFYDSLAASGTFSMSSFDVQGVSYYPFWSTSSTIANFQTAVNNMANTYKKKIIVMETDYPVACTTTTNFPPSLLSAYPFSAAGQVQWVKAIAAVVNAIPNSLGVGVMYWEPGWIDNASLGSSCSDNVLFTGDWSGYPSTVIAKARSSVSMMSQI